MLAKFNSCGLDGINGYSVCVEIDINSGLPGIEMVGLPDAAIKESKERVKSAIKNSGFLLAPKKITINLAPADTKKEGAMYDVPIALGILAATGQISTNNISDTIFLGELSLDGNIRHANGILPIILFAKSKGYKNIAIPYSNLNEAKYVDGVNILPFKSLKETVSYIENPVGFNNEYKFTPLSSIARGKYSEDFKYIKGQYAARRALEIAAAGGHNVILIGPPGGGKTMLAKCLPTILPDMTSSEALETTKIHSVAGSLDEKDGIIINRPFRTPHHTTTKIALTGGGNKAKPGEISMAHNGVLFLDELLEYKRDTLEILRQPLEDNVITISRNLKNIAYPANFMLVASLNPCPCGYYGSPVHDCTCTPAQITKYLSKLSGPLMDRIDLHIEVNNVTYDDLTVSAESECSDDIKQRVNETRNIQLARFMDTGIYCNAKMNNMMLGEFCKLDSESDRLLNIAYNKMGLSARAYGRILKVARTIADMEKSTDIKSKHIAEAIQYRSLDRSFWK